MKAPMKFYVLVSRKSDGEFLATEKDRFLKKKGAIEERDQRNYQKAYGVNDWRIETYVKGD